MEQADFLEADGRLVFGAPCSINAQYPASLSFCHQCTAGQCNFDRTDEYVQVPVMAERSFSGPARAPSFHRVPSYGGLGHGPSPRVPRTANGVSHTVCCCSALCTTKRFSISLQNNLCMPCPCTVQPTNQADEPLISRSIPELSQRRWQLMSLWQSSTWHQGEWDCTSQSWCNPQSQSCFLFRLPCTVIQAPLSYTWRHRFFTALRM